MACVTVKHFTEAFRRRDARNEGKLTIDYNTFVSRGAVVEVVALALVAVVGADVRLFADGSRD
jgi:hypothetical protein